MDGVGDEKAEGEDEGEGDEVTHLSLPSKYIYPFMTCLSSNFSCVYHCFCLLFLSHRMMKMQRRRKKKWGWRVNKRNRDVGGGRIY